MKMKNITWVLFCSILLSCKGSIDLEKFSSARIGERKGTPALFYLNESEFSAKNFRKEFFFERKHIARKFEPVTPPEIEAELQRYIEETIILNEAIAKADLNSAEAQKYLWPFIRKAVISYYLSKESGEFEVAENSNEVEVSDELIEQYYSQNKELLKEKNPTELKKKLKNTAILIKIQERLALSQEKKKIILGKMRQNNKVRIVQKEVFTKDLYEK
ncbi:hypothetical protein [Leptospira mayottensis]|uniref:hypothetical protein n=1 Tax=Leptospira mayottensis TaxID=1137606 RepID=UPI0020B1720E|nr:hypothetical protein [Leptospira mayottensis]